VFGGIGGASCVAAYMGLHPTLMDFALAGLLGWVPRVWCCRAENGILALIGAIAIQNSD
jgi:hypothetical protein